MAYKKSNKEKTREEILQRFKKNKESLIFSLCDICSRENCNVENRLKGIKQPMEECFQPMREMYDEKYALER